MRRFAVPLNLIKKRTKLNSYRRLRQTALAVIGTAVASISSLGLANAAVSKTWTVKPGDTFWSIAKANHLSLTSLESANPNVSPLNLPVGSRLIIPSSQGSSPSSATSRMYIIQPGDTFWRIAKRFGLSVGQLTAVNPNLNAANLIPGNVMRLPSAPSLSTNSGSSTDLYWLAHVIHAEANGLSLQAQIGVGDVVLHRVQSPDYPNTIKGVIFEITNGHYQFTCVANGYINSQPDARSIQAAKEVLQQHVDVVPGAFVFYNPAKTPASSWVWQQPTITAIGPFVFAK